MICPKCQKENDDDSRFCVQCGYKFNTSENSDFGPIIFAILGLFTSIVLLFASIYETMDAKNNLDSYTNTMNNVNGFFSSSGFSQLSQASQAMSQTGTDMLQQWYTYCLADSILLVIIIILAIVSLVLIYKKIKTAKYTLAGCGALTAVLAIPTLNILINYPNISFGGEVLNSASLLSPTLLWGFVVGVAIAAIFYFSAALLYET